MANLNAALDPEYQQRHTTHAQLWPAQTLWTKIIINAANQFDYLPDVRDTRHIKQATVSHGLCPLAIFGQGRRLGRDGCTDRLGQSQPLGWLCPLIARPFIHARRRVAG